MPKAKPDKRKPAPTAAKPARREKANATRKAKPIPHNKNWSKKSKPTEVIEAEAMLQPVRQESADDIVANILAADGSIQRYDLPVASIRWPKLRQQDHVLCRHGVLSGNIAYQLVLLSAYGLPDTIISEIIGVTKQTILVWRRQYPDLHRAMQSSRAQRYAGVVNSLFEAAVNNHSVTAALALLANKYPEEFKPASVVHKTIQVQGLQIFNPDDIRAIREQLMPVREVRQHTIESMAEELGDRTEREIPQEFQDDPDL